MRIRYGAPEATINPSSGASELASLPLPVLGIKTDEPLPLRDGAYQPSDAFHTWRDGQLVIGIAKAPCDDATLRQTSYDLYSRLFETTRGAHLYRIWNYLPGINSGKGDQERYKQFCAGRSDSFHHRFLGENESAYMPAGTCVGSESDQLAIVFLAGDARPDHHENPNQTPAYRYPRQYGPRAPSFARATTVEANGARYWFISGTASVIGHRSEAVGDLARQVEITCDNLERITAEATASPSSETSNQVLLSGKVYLRSAKDYPQAHSILKKRLPSIADQLTYLESEICREELLIEIELSYASPVTKSHA